MIKEQLWASHIHGKVIMTWSGHTFNYCGDVHHDQQVENWTVHKVVYQNLQGHKTRLTTLQLTKSLERHSSSAGLNHEQDRSSIPSERHLQHPSFP